LILAVLWAVETAPRLAREGEPCDGCFGRRASLRGRRVRRRTQRLCVLSRALARLAAPAGRASGGRCGSGRPPALRRRRGSGAGAAGAANARPRPPYRPLVVRAGTKSP